MPAAAALLDRPLFSTSRRPPPPAPPPPDTAAAPAPPPPPFQGFLRGIVIGHGGPVALIGHPGQAETITLRESERIDGWLVARIEPGALVLRSGDTETRLDITPPALSVRPAGMTPAKPASAPPEAQQASPGANAPAGGRSTLAVYRRAR
jgi:general secretion pathway protein N